MSNAIKKTVTAICGSRAIYGVSSHECSNRKLFDYVEQWQNTDKTLLQFFSRSDESGVEHFVGIRIQLLPDNTIDMMSLMLTQSLWDNNEHAKASNTVPKIYFI